jgi:hypothetical protein
LSVTEASLCSHALEDFLNDDTTVAALLQRMDALQIDREDLLEGEEEGTLEVGVVEVVDRIFHDIKLIISGTIIFMNKT